MVETTPFVFQGKLYRFEWVRPEYEGNKAGSHYRIVEPTTGETVSTFGAGHTFGCAYVEGDTVWVFGTRDFSGSSIGAFWSKDLKTWESAVAMELPGWKLFNCSVCKGPDGYIMAFEVGHPPEVTGTPFTTRFLKSPDLRKWELIPEPAVYTKDRYSACPTIRFLDGFYYMAYLEHMVPAWQFQTYMARSRDLIRWELSPRNPVLKHEPEQDKQIHNDRLTPEQRERIKAAEDINSSDIDWCEHDERVVIHYSWGSQRGVEFLAEAVFEGTEAQFLKGWFPE